MKKRSLEKKNFQKGRYLLLGGSEYIIFGLCSNI